MVFWIVLAMKHTAIKLIPQGRFFLEFHKFFHRQGDRAVFHPNDMRVFIEGMDESDRDFTIQKLTARGHKVTIVGVEWQQDKKNFVEIQVPKRDDA
jgi:hypothetical protein